MYYFDYASTCPINKKVFDLCVEQLGNGIFNNPSSTHEEGISDRFSKKIKEYYSWYIKMF